MAADLEEEFDRLAIADDGLPTMLSSAVMAHRQNIPATDADISMIIHALVLIHVVLDDYTGDERLCLTAFYWLRSIADYLQGAQPIWRGEFTNPYDYDHVGMIDHLQQHTMMLWLQILGGEPSDIVKFTREFTSALEGVL